MDTIDLIEALANTNDAGRHNLMLIIQHLLEVNPEQTLVGAMSKAIAWLQENEKENFKTPADSDLTGYK